MRGGMPSRGGGALGRAYAAVGALTPLPVDCGLLCGAACCKDRKESGCGEEYGMLLFPGEAGRFHGVGGFRLEHVDYMAGRAWMLFCDLGCGCVRRLRPLACRVFPLAPHVGEGGRVVARPDPRARAICPLADGGRLDPRFTRAVGRAFRELAQDAESLRFMKLLSCELDELGRFFR